MSPSFPISRRFSPALSQREHIDRGVSVQGRLHFFVDTLRTIIPSSRENVVSKQTSTDTSITVCLIANFFSNLCRSGFPAVKVTVSHKHIDRGVSENESPTKTNHQNGYSDTNGITYRCRSRLREFVDTMKMTADLSYQTTRGYPRRDTV